MMTDVTATRKTPTGIMERLETVIAAPDATLVANPSGIAHELLELGETILERWLDAHGTVPTPQLSEGFRLLALHRQGARGDPSFNACRETCREIVYHRNLITSEPGHPDTARRVRLAAMVARHLALFIDGKLEAAELGEFCCSSRPLRTRGAASAATTVPE